MFSANFNLKTLIKVFRCVLQHFIKCRFERYNRCNLRGLYSMFFFIETICLESYITFKGYLKCVDPNHSMLSSWFATAFNTFLAHLNGKLK